MGKIKKKITVRFFSIEASSNFFEDFSVINHSSWTNDTPIRFFNIRDKKHLIKLSAPSEYNGQKTFFFSIVKERATWQARALADGDISAIHFNQGILGDLFYYLVIPSNKLILGFTAGPSASVRSVANAVLHQFKKDRTSKILLEPIAKESGYGKLKEMVEFTEMRFTLTPASLNEPTDDMPNMFRAISSLPFMAGGSKLELTVSEFGEGNFTREDLLAAVDYLTGNDCCTALFIKGVNTEGEKIQLNLNKSHLIFDTHIELRENFVNENSAKQIVYEALDSLNIL